MAERVATYTWSDLLAVVGQGVRASKEDELGALICNLTLNTVWKRYDWRETIKLLPTFYLIPDEQDYGPPAVSVPADFLGLRYADLVRLTAIPPARIPLAIIKDLQLTHTRFLPQSMCYEPTKRCFRVFPRTPINIGVPEWMIEGKYKFKPTKLTAATLATTVLPWDDIHFWDLIEVGKWAAYALTENPKAGNISVANGQTTFTGQAAAAFYHIDVMARNESLEQGDPVIHPAEPLVAGGPWGGAGNSFTNLILGI